MTEGRAPATAWLALKVAAFTVVVPGTVVVLVPYLLLPDPSLGAIDVLGVTFVGILPIVLGAALYVRSAVDFVRAGRGTPAPLDPPTALVTRGPYGYCRNPMYLGVLAIVAGEALIYRDPGLLAYLIALAVVFYLVTVIYEEWALRRQFGVAYAAYRESVPRWLPRRSRLARLFRETFSTVGAFVLAAGTLAHVLRLTVGLPVTETPDSLHALLVLLPGYAATGCIVYARRIPLPGAAGRVAFGFLSLLLVVTAVMHLYSIVARDSSWLGVFPTWYSVVAIVVYGAGARFLKTRVVAEA